MSRNTASAETGTSLKKSKSIDCLLPKRSAIAVPP